MSLTIIKATCHGEDGDLWSGLESSFMQSHFEAWGVQAFARTPYMICAICISQQNIIWMLSWQLTNYILYYHSQTQYVV